MRTADFDATLKALLQNYVNLSFQKGGKYQIKRAVCRYSWNTTAPLLWKMNLNVKWGRRRDNRCWPVAFKIMAREAEPLQATGTLAWKIPKKNTFGFFLPTVKEEGEAHGKQLFHHFARFVFIYYRLYVLRLVNTLKRRATLNSCKGLLKKLAINPFGSWADGSINHHQMFVMLFAGTVDCVTRKRFFFFLFPNAPLQFFRLLLLYVRLMARDW